MERQLLFSVSVQDCLIDTFRSGGPGGQNRNKVNSAIRLIHPPSGAVASAKDSRDQIHNKRSAFMRLIETKEFKAWHKMEIARRMK